MKKIMCPILIVRVRDKQDQSKDKAKRIKYHQERGNILIYSTPCLQNENWTG